MPDFWEFPTVSTGLAPIMAIYQARFNEYIKDRGLKDTTNQPLLRPEDIQQNVDAYVTSHLSITRGEKTSANRRNSAPGC